MELMLNRRKAVRRLAKAILGTAAAILVWRSRLVQVATFITAAAIRRWRRAAVAPGPASRSAEWSTVQMPNAPLPTLKQMALVTYHPEYHSYDPKRAISSLIAATGLGVGWLRSDLRWHEILPDGTYIDREAVAWYRSFLNAASALGLKNMVVLSDPH
jgi:hypothetical protein